MGAFYLEMLPHQGRMPEVMEQDVLLRVLRRYGRDSITTAGRRLEELHNERRRPPRHVFDSRTRSFEP
jgi:hypothetical protein